jgi:transposase
MKFAFVSIDLWKPYKILVEELMPNAQVVADRFHVMKQVNDEFDQQRKQHKYSATKQDLQIKKPTNSAINKSKYPLLKKKNNLNV